MVIGGQLKVNLMLFHLCCWKTDFCVSMDGHPQAMVVVFPHFIAMQGFKEATMGVTNC